MGLFLNIRRAHFCPVYAESMPRGKYLLKPSTLIKLFER